ncbi:hypothetical protein A8M77_15350 [Variovorax sp. JS1663]|nr:hypothetical protein A8M77_15350 [Variovorax sp. JS1663]
MDTLGSRIKAARLRKGMTQAELSQRAAVGQGDISKLENGTVSGSTKVVQMARALGCDPYWLATGEGEPWGQPASPDMEFTGGGNVVGLAVRGSSLFLEGNVQIDEHDAAAGGVVLGSGVHDGYAIKVVGDRNAPALKDGQFVVVEATSPVAPGDLGLFHLSNGDVLLRELLRETDDNYYVDSAAWGARQTLPRASVTKTEHIVAVVSPSRWRKIE